MSAMLFKFGDPPETDGGDFELLVATKLRDSLHSHAFVITNFATPTGKMHFYEYDIIVMNSAYCYIVEAKRYLGLVRVGEESVYVPNDSVRECRFQTLSNKRQVLRSKLEKGPFYLGAGGVPEIAYMVVLPDETTIEFERNEATKKWHECVVNLSKASTLLHSCFAEIPNGYTSHEVHEKLKRGWKKCHEKTHDRSEHRLGRFRLRRKVATHSDGGREFLAVDEPPCEVEVSLREFPFDSLASPEDIRTYQEQVSREMKTLRTIRHPNIACVTGHFRTESSLVQVSDWFPGSTLDNCWNQLHTWDFEAKVALIQKIAVALTYCHGKNVFHRNIQAGSVLFDDATEEVRLCGFDFAKNFKLERTVSTAIMEARDKRIIPPETLEPGNSPNYRLADVFQFGVLIYRILENGEWPFESTYDYAIEEAIRSPKEHEVDSRCLLLRALIERMMALSPEKRPQFMDEVEITLRELIKVTS